jgi:hypothetical protein
MLPGCAAKISVGLLINFGAPTLREGLRRIVNGYEPSAFPRLRVNQVLPATMRVAPESKETKTETKNPGGCA